MSLTDILNNVTIINDCSSSSVSILIGALATAGLAILGIIALVLIIVRATFIDSAPEIVVLVTGTILFLASSILGIWYYIVHPENIKMYVYAGNTPVMELSTYFDLDQISEIDDNTFLYIKPKAEYYDETLEWYRQNVK